jgi:hypothetical protein
VQPQLFGVGKPCDRYFVPSGNSASISPGVANCLVHGDNQGPLSWAIDKDRNVGNVVESRRSKDSLSRRPSVYYRNGQTFNGRREAGRPWGE